MDALTGAAFLRAPSLDQRPRPRAVRDRQRGRCLAGRPQHRRALPPGLGGRHARRPGRHRRAAHRARCAGRRHRPRRPPRRSTPRTPTGSSSRSCWLVPADRLTPEILDSASTARPARPARRDRAVRRRHPRRHRHLGPRPRLTLPAARQRSVCAGDTPTRPACSVCRRTFARPVTGRVLDQPSGSQARRQPRTSWIGAMSHVLLALVGDARVTRPVVDRRARRVRRTAPRRSSRTSAAARVPTIATNAAAAGCDSPGSAPGAESAIRTSKPSSTRRTTSAASSSSLLGAKR